MKMCSIVNINQITVVIMLALLKKYSDELEKKSIDIIEKTYR